MKLFSSLLLLASTFAVFHVNAADVTTDRIPEQGSGIEHIPYDLRPMYDKTDIFAIPVDDSEIEEQIEMQELEELQDKVQSKKK